MNVIHVITTLDRGGAENQLVTLVSAQVKSGKNVSIIYLKGTGDLKTELEKYGANVLDEFANKNIIKQLYLLRKILKRNENSVLHAHLPRAEIVSYLSFTRNPRIATRHNAEQFYPSAPRWLSRLLAVLVTKDVKCLIAISRAVSDDIVMRNEINSATNLRTVLYGFEMQGKLDKASTLDLQEISGISNQGTNVIFAANRLTEQKDIQTMLHGYARYLKNNPHTILLIAGEGKLEKILQSLASELGISEKVIWLGKVHNIESYFEISDLFLLTSVYEGLGMVLLESIWTEVPIVATNVSAIPEVLGKDYIGLFELKNVDDLASKIDLILNQPEARQTALMQLKKRRELFDPNSMEQSISEIYDWVSK